MKGIDLRIKARKHLCRLLGHEYRAIWFKGNQFGQCGVADTEAGCVYCGHTEPNHFLMNINDIDWEATKHRTEPPKHKTYIA